MVEGIQARTVQGDARALGRRIILLLVIINAAALAHVIHNAIFPFPIEASDGGMLSSAWQVARGRPIYNELSAPPFVFNIHNPLFIYASGLTMKVFGPEPAAVRLLAEAMLIGAAVFVYLCVRRLGGSVTAAAIAALLLPVERSVVKRSGLAVCDFSALFFSMMGLWLWFGGGRRRYLALAAFVLAYFGKQSAVVAPLAVVAGLAMESGAAKSRRAVLFAVLWACGIVAGLAVVTAVLGKAFALNTLFYGTIKQFDHRQAMSAMLRAGALYPLLFVAAALAARDAGRRSVALYVAGGAVLGYMSGIEGASNAYLFDLSAGLAIAAGLAWQRAAALLDAGGRRGGLAAAALIIQCALVTLGVLHGGRDLWRRAAGADIHKARAALYARPDALVLTAIPGYELGRAGETFSTDPHALAQILRAGRVLPPGILVSLARARAFTGVILPRTGDVRGRFTPALRAAIQDNYIVIGESTNELYLVPGSS